MEWKTIFDKSESEPFTRKLTEIAGHLKHDINNIKSNDLFFGKAGVAIFLFYYAAYTGKQEYADLGHEIIGDVFDALEGAEVPGSFSSGLAGTGWAFEHLVQSGFINACTDELLGDMDTLLYEYMLHCIKENNYDFLHGALGAGIYFVSRSANKNNQAHKYLAQLVTGLQNMSISDREESKKWKMPRYDKNEIVYDLGLAHGIASIIYFLSQRHDPANRDDIAAGLLPGAVRY